MKAVQARIDAMRAAEPGNQERIPVDLHTVSGRGLDPDISPAGAEYQNYRVTKARGLDDARIRDIVVHDTKGRWLGTIGEQAVNVLELNLALDDLK
jgi:K+-transporting ATPase ATPase C chain